jgi:hypothetical protein
MVKLRWIVLWGAGFGGGLGLGWWGLGFVGEGGVGDGVLVGVFFVGGLGVKGGGRVDVVGSVWFL